MTSRRPRATLLGTAALAASLALVLAGCGSEDDTATPVGNDTETGSPTSTDSPSDTPSDSPSDGAADLPECAAVWTVGERLPVGYRGCLEDGEPVRADATRCSLGRDLVIYDDRFYAQVGGPVNRTEGPVEQDRAYRTALSSCTA